MKYKVNVQYLYTNFKLKYVGRKNAQTAAPP